MEEASSSNLKKGKRILLTAREKKSVVNYCLERRELTPGLLKNDLYKLAAKIFMISKSQVRQIFKNFEKGEPLLNSNKGGGQKNTYDDEYYLYYLKKELSRKIYAYHESNEHFTIDDLLHYAQTELEFTSGRSTLFKIIKSMGFRYKNYNGRAILCEQSHVKALQLTFLKKYLQHLQSNEQITFIFLDETWIYQNGSNVQMWIHESDLRANPKRVKCEGKRFTVLHAGCKYGFLEDCGMLLDSKIEDRDYHKTMNGNIFEKWVQNQLIPALQKIEGKCVVVMDNAPYHSVQINKPPSYGSKKDIMKEWLTLKNIRFDEGLTKNQLWALIKPLAQQEKKSYVVDNLLSSKGFEVLRLPPYNCQYNPIELAWAFSKNFYNKHIRKTDPSCKGQRRVGKVWEEALSHYTPEMWQRSVTHCEKLIKNDWEKYMGNLPIENLPPIIISLTESDSEFEFSDSE